MMRKTLGIIALALVCLTVGYILGTQSAEPVSAQIEPDPPTAQRDEVFAPFWETWDLLHSIYVDAGEIDDTVLMEGALRGMLGVIDDPNTGYMTPYEFQLATESLQGSFEGIGAYVRKDEVTGALRIVSVIETSPAEAAGVLAGDSVYEVDGEDITGLDQTQMVNRVRGPAGSTVILSIRREGVPGLLEITVVRASVTIPSVESEIIGGVAYLRLLQFGAQTTEEQRAALAELMANDPRGLILDLRGNAGGYLQTAVDVAGEFIGEGIVLIERTAEDEVQFTTELGGLAETIPMVVLVDQGSASASEILAGALQDTGRATIIGVQTFGKGTAQNWRPLSNGGAARITIARWYTPGGHTVEGDGLMPDVEISWPSYAVFDGFDPALEAALRVLDGKTVWPTWPIPAPLGFPHVIP
ncbi:MAG: S41 family peptidase [Anaerolineae bacterium]|nr:S41 family peptidase [Anaerolineae bacterium]